MQSKDITVGEHYAYTYSRSRRARRYMQEVKVVSTANGRAEVEFVDGGTRRDVPVASIIKSWADHEAQTAREKAYADEVHEQARADVAAIDEIIGTKMARHHGIEVEIHGDGSYSHNVSRMTYREIREIVEAAYARGQAEHDVDGRG